MIDIRLKKMKRFILVSAIILWCGATTAQEKKVAVFDPVGDITNSVKEIVREEISAAIVNIGGYTVLERQLINKVLEENTFQMGGLVDNEQISAIGKLMGANYVFVSSITSLERNYYISCKMIEVTTARIEKQKTAQTKKVQQI
jgi:curli biogenesis system outer membrane secretion channel CsgG